ncbi:MAG: hypothetical protein DCF18_01005 [Cyanobium sp.]|nr:MAG: hypothetical protein DCF18_01005 [Cyanobium sp.]
MPSWVPRIDTPRRALEQQNSGPLNGPSVVDLSFAGLGVDGLFLEVSCSVAAWVTFYDSTAARTADAARPIEEDPPLSAGVLLDLRFSAETPSLKLAPGCSYSNGENPLQQRIWARLRTEVNGAHTASLGVLALVLNDSVGS